MDKLYDVGGWRPMTAFLVTQGSGKQRRIDNAKRALHNLFAFLWETIYTISVDWVAETA